MVPRPPRQFISASISCDDWERLIADAAAIAEPTTEPQRIVPVLLARMEAAWVRGLVVATEDLQWLTAAVRDGKARELHDEIAFWLWRSGAESPVRPAQGSPQTLQISGRWEEAAAQWRARGCRLRATCVLVDGDQVAVSASRALLTSWGRGYPSTGRPGAGAKRLPHQADLSEPTSSRHDRSASLQIHAFATRLHHIEPKLPARGLGGGELSGQKKGALAARTSRLAAHPRWGVSAAARCSRIS
jgi:hypothetical protein